MSQLPIQFDKAMYEIYRRAQTEARYLATAFLRLLHEQGGVGAAKIMLNASMPSEIYHQMALRGRLDLTVEALVADEPHWHSLFTASELARAKARLDQFGYRGRW